MAEELLPQIAAYRPYGSAVCQQIVASIVRLGFPVQTKLQLPVYDHAKFSTLVDPFTQDQNLVGYWYDTRQQRIGQIKFHADGSFYAEYDVALPHPLKKQFFVEAIQAWGKEQAIKTEAKLLAIPTD